jgi:uncharacterized protein (DUF1800 family)
MLSEFRAQGGRVVGGGPLAAGEVALARGLTSLCASLRRYETESLLDHLATHPNTPPFIAHRLIQRFVSSNPSPRYVEAVANAFTSGSYDVFGAGKHGDMAATIAAVLLDREARTPVLDADSSHGTVREPLLKIMSVLRSLEYASGPPIGGNEASYKINLKTLESKIGQNAWCVEDATACRLRASNPLLAQALAIRLQLL